MTARINPVDAVNGAPTYVARAWRQTAVAPFVGGATPARPLGARSGVRPGGAPSVVVSSSTVITVGPFAGVIDGETANEAGPYGFAFDAATAQTINPANASNPRVDLISVQVSDPAESDGSVTPSIALVYTAGTAVASPSQPATPARSFPLVRVNVPASGGGNPTATFIGPYMVAAGGVLPVDTAANLALVQGWPGARATVFADPDTTKLGNYTWSVSAGSWSMSSYQSGPALAFPTGYAAGGDLVYGKQDGMVYGTMHVARGSGQILSTDVMGVLPAGFRPTQTITGIIGLATPSNATMAFNIATNGQITPTLLESAAHVQARFQFAFRQGN